MYCHFLADKRASSLVSLNQTLPGRGCSMTGILSGQLGSQQRRKDFFQGATSSLPAAPDGPAPALHTQPGLPT